MLYPAHLLDHLSETGAHQQEIEALFQGAVRWEGDAPVIAHPLIVLAFSNRSGSNYLAELMRSTGKLAGLGEALNAETVAKRCDAWGVDRFPDYFMGLAARHKLPFGVKASWDQLLMLMRFRIPQMYAGLRVVHIHRRDVVGQAISRDIAWQTGKWTSLTPVERPVEPQYDARAVTGQLAAVQLAEALFPLIFEAFDMRVAHVAYEDLAATPWHVVRRTMSEIGYPCPEWHPTGTRIRKQADATNDAFRDSYRGLLRQACLDTDTPESEG